MSTHEIDDRLLIELKGPGVEPRTVDSVALLRLATEFLLLVLAVAKEDDDDSELAFSGVEILDKCAAAAVTPSDPAEAREASERATKFVRGTLSPGAGLAASCERVRTAIRGLSPEVTAAIVLGQWSNDLTLGDVAANGSVRETTDLRCEVLRVGGKKPTTLLRSQSESRPFTARMQTREQATALARSLYQVVDAELRLTRNDALEIAEADLLGFEVPRELSPEEALEALREAGAAWRDIPNPLAVLRAEREA